MFTRIAFALALSLAATSAWAEHKEIGAYRTQTITAKVKKVDQKTREVTLVGKDGKETTFTAGENVKNLKQVKAGDTLTAKLDQALTLWVLAPDEAAPELAVSSDVHRAPAGKKPAGSVSADLQGVATVEAIADDKSTVTLKGPRGNLVKLDVRDKSNLDGVTVGTRIGFAYSEVLALDVKTPKKK